MRDMTNVEPQKPSELLLAELQRLRRAAGDPSYRAIAREIETVSHTTVTEVFAGRRAPSWPVLADIVRYLGGSEDRFRVLWNATMDSAVAKSPHDIAQARDNGFVGRQEELAALEALLSEATFGQPATVLVGGEAGIGKSCLAAAFAEHAGRAGAQVLIGTCIGLVGGSVPYAPLAEMIRRLQRTQNESGTQRDVKSALTQLASLITVTDVTRVPGPQALVFGLTLKLIEQLNAESPVVMIFEDLHWADPSTLDLILYLTRTRSNQQLLLLCTYRTGDLMPGHPLWALLAEPAFARMTVRMQLPPFTEAELSTFLRMRGLSDQGQFRRIFELSEGNAFFAEELLNSQVLSGQQPNVMPETLSQVVHGRMGRLSESAKLVLRAAAVAGRQVHDTQVLRAVAVADRQVHDGLLKLVTNLDDLRLNAALRECRDSGLLIPDLDGIYRFRHALLQEVVYQDLLPGERRSIHTAVVEAITEQPTLGAFGEGAATVIELAYHWYQTGRKPQALAAAVRAGAAATDMRAFREALSHYEKAMALWPEVPEAAAVSPASYVDLLADCANAARWAGRVEQAVGLIRFAIDQLDPVRDADTAVKLYERLGRYEWEAGRTRSADADKEAQGLLGPGAQGPVMARVQAGLASAALREGRYSDGLRLAKQAVALARSSNARAEEGRALGFFGLARAMLGDIDKGIESLRDAVRIAGEVHNLEDHLSAYANLGVVLEEAERLPEAVHEAQEGYRLAVQFGLGDTRRGRLLANNASAGLVLLGRWGEARGLLEIALRTAPPVAESAYARLTLAELDVAQGRFSEATRILAELGDPAPVSDPRFLESLYTCQAELALWRGQPDAALASIDHGIKTIDLTENTLTQLRLFAVGLRASAELPDRAAAAQHADRLMAAVHQRTSQPPSPREKRTLKLLCEAEHDRASGRDTAQTWNEVAAAWEELHRPYRTAYARWRQALAATNANEKHQTALAAHDTARPLDAVPLLAEIAKLLGTPPRPVPSADSFGLTRRELEVLRRVLSGQTNRLIAKELSISESTAGVHISNILRKLQVRSRTEAAVFAKLLFPDSRTTR